MPWSPRLPVSDALSLDLFNYKLPRERIAQHPLPERDAARRDVERLQRELDGLRLDQRAERGTHTSEVNELRAWVERLEKRFRSECGSP